MASVTEWLQSNPGYLMGNAIIDNGDGSESQATYYRVPKADGGYDYFRVGMGGKDVRSIAEGDAYGELGAQAPAAPAAPAYSGGGSVASGPTMAQLNAALEAHNTQKKQIEDAKALGLLDIRQAEEMIGQNREQLKKDLQGGYEGNQSYFSQVSPDAYQSQVQNYDTKVLDAYNTSNKSLDQNQERIGLARNAVESQFANEMANANASYADYTGASGVGGVGGYNAGGATAVRTATPGVVQGNALQSSAMGAASPNMTNNFIASRAINKLVDPVSEYNSGASALLENLNK